jgi:hypothetical protein
MFTSTHGPPGSPVLLELSAAVVDDVTSIEVVLELVDSGPVDSSIEPVDSCIVVSTGGSPVLVLVPMPLVVAGVATGGSSPQLAARDSPIHRIGKRIRMSMAQPSGMKFSQA